MSGRSRLPNSYLYDKEIVPRQRRWVFLKGCVTNESQSAELERLAREVDDVEIVFNELMVGIRGKPKYRTAAPQKSRCTDG
jgi:osmotically-inducible protein OsmY